MTVVQRNRVRDDVAWLARRALFFEHYAPRLTGLQSSRQKPDGNGTTR
jgi:hypothetical protein